MPSDAEIESAVKAYAAYIDDALKGGAKRWHVRDAVVAALEAAERTRRIDEVVRTIAVDGDDSAAAGLSDTSAAE
ncbi:hypothetical protein CCR97_11470 [Rhodoplanes elegans]|uniref:Uncharacterized protein n=1 Tax=Rhodoplanes elegans TaxID=29408 RepID=A0A327L1B1_9BRAD|nr:hypothetical protein [Rhodoplanes elegans]MBK5958823.1 hypothetical protein [Rhodoplanes elegans]RAI41478.1 hypothetical protein CH338_02915 [Rhodoplanes elegans]